MFIVKNDVVSLSVSSARGSSIDSLKVLGTETIDIQDLGREIQTSLFFPSTPEVEMICDGVNRHWINLQDAGNDYGVSSRLCHEPMVENSSISIGAYPQLCPKGGELWPESTSDYFKVMGKYTIGPLDYAPYNEIILLDYHFYSTKTLEFLHQVCDEEGIPTPVPLIPFIFFKNNTLTRLYGLSLDSWEWKEHTPYSGALYHPSQYHYCAMAWMKSDLSWGVAIYGGWTLYESNINNFVAQSYPDYKVNYLALVDQSLTTIQAGDSNFDHTGVNKQVHLLVGNLDTIQGMAHSLYQQQK